MSSVNTPSPAAETAAQVARQSAAQQDAVAALHAELAATLDETLRLQQRSLAVIEAMRSDVDRVRRQLRRMATARS
jgi:hypothetical protein